MPLTAESAARKDRTQPTDANFQHRHYAEIARIIREGFIPEIQETVIAVFSSELAWHNTNFDRNRFMAACQPSR